MSSAREFGVHHSMAFKRNNKAGRQTGDIYRGKPILCIVPTMGDSDSNGAGAACVRNLRTDHATSALGKGGPASRVAEEGGELLDHSSCPSGGQDTVGAGLVRERWCTDDSHCAALTPLTSARTCIM